MQKRPPTSGYTQTGEVALNFNLGQVTAQPKAGVSFKGKDSSFVG